MAKNPLKSRIENIEGSRIMIAPLNWGLGHATRCVPIIKALIETNKEALSKLWWQRIPQSYIGK